MGNTNQKSCTCRVDGKYGGEDYYFEGECKSDGSCKCSKLFVDAYVSSNNC